MKVRFAFLCDYAEASSTGKINALGIGFGNIFAPQVPCRHPHFSVVVQFETSSVESGKKEVRIDLIDEDGNSIIPPAQGAIDIPAPKGSATATGQFVMEFNNVEFKKYGTYSLRVGIGGVEITDIPFRVAPAPAPAK